MDLLTDIQLKDMVENLKQQLDFPREKMSVSVPELLKWVEGKMPEDPFLNAELLKANPWVESGKCVVL
ncbi:guanine nucleotide-binding protein G(I)/G(S)/G(O) subunit gamma-13a [Hemibagrus wyckioides]|nr:guanine nucleotide-binding protein G(I)/G(S)/G(O) subunit gamma-13a [Hemibagrus wyckioides]